MSEPAWLAADLGAASDLSPPSRAERMRHSPPNAHGKEEDGKDGAGGASSSGGGRAPRRCISLASTVCCFRLFHRRADWSLPVGRQRGRSHS